MNGIEETLLLIFLESRMSMRVPWEEFKQQELGRTLPEEFEYYATEYTIKFMKEGGNLPTFLKCHRSSNFNRKIKIMVVNYDR